MKKFSYIILAFLFLVLAGCRSDEFKWNNQTVGEDEYLIAFAPSSPIVDVVGKTRSAANRDEITEVMLLMFAGNDPSSQLIEYIDVSGDNKLQYNFTTPSATHQGSITVPIAAVKNSEVNTWYLVANANQKIKDSILAATGTINKQTLFSEVLFDADQLEGKEDHVMIGYKTGVTPKAGQENAQIFTLERVYSQVSAEINVDLNKIPFRMTGMKLYSYVDKGDLNCSGLQELTSNSSQTEDWVETLATGTLASTTDRNGTSFNHTAKGQQFLSVSYPYNPMNADGTERDKVIMVIKGYYEATAATPDPEVAPAVSGSAYEFDTSEDEVFYAIEMPRMVANHHYRVLINGATTTGQKLLSDAVAHPNTLTVDFVDETEEIRDIVSDGENVLAVQDTLWIDAKQTSAIINIKARAAGSASPKIRFSNDAAPVPSWIRTGLTLGSDYVGTKINSEEETASGLFNAKFNLPLTFSANRGAEREYAFVVSLDGCDLTRTITVIQRMDEDIKYDDIFKVKLEILRGGAVETTIDDYLTFIRSGVTTPAADAPTLFGIAPDENGGRIRNLGLHKPMPNGGNVTYRYSLWKTNASATVQFSSSSESATGTGASEANPFVLQFTDGTNYDYIVNPDAIRITSGSGDDAIELTLDTYHTGFFWHHSDGWYYYEAFKMRSSGDLRWLDRNLGAKSAGMGSLNGSAALTSSSWPIVGDKAMGKRYNLEEARADCPTGWSVPSFAMMRAMTVQAAFNTESMATVPNKVPYFAPTFTFTGTEGSKNVSIRSYFPQNRYTSNGSLGGDSQAGYYLTTTGAGTAGWYQVMNFNGTNTTSINMDFSKVKASVRCVSGTYSLAGNTTYACNVKGYTHVFLYYEYNGSKTYFNTWPGEQVAMDNDIDRYHPFELNSTIDYSNAPGNVYVIFNEVDANGVVKKSNVSSEKVLRRDGILFKNGGNYDVASLPVAEGAINGNWSFQMKSSRIAIIMKKGAATNSNVEKASIAIDDAKSEVFGTGDNSWLNIGDDYYMLTLDVKYSSELNSYAEANATHTYHRFGTTWVSWSENDNFVKINAPAGAPSNIQEYYMIWSQTKPAAPTSYNPPRTDKDWKVAFIWKSGVDGSSNWAHIWYKYNASADITVNGNWDGRYSDKTIGSNYYYHLYTMTVPLDFSTFESDSRVSNIKHKLTDSDERSWSDGYHKKLTTIPEGLDVDEAYLIWCGNTEPSDPSEADEVKYAVYGEFGNSGWAATAMTKSGSVWTSSVIKVTKSSAAFGIREYNDIITNQTAWFNASGSVNVNLTAAGEAGPYTLSSSGTSNISIQNQGEYIISFNSETKQLTVTRTDTPSAGDEFTYAVHGNFSGGDWYSVDMTKNGDNWEVVVNVTANHNFGIKKMKGEDQVGWIAKEDSNGNISLNSDVQCKLDGSNFWLTETGNLKYSYNPTTNILRVTRVSSAARKKVTAKSRR